MASIIIADTSCLILYDKIERLDILKNTFNTITITQEVMDEFGQELTWANIEEYQNKHTFISLTEKLGKGEASSIALALEKPDSILLIDEKKGRKIATDLGLNLIGSLKEKGIITEVASILKLIEKTDFRINQAIKAHLLNLAGEK
jgi:predicted nucleic acid-binding protein